MCPHTHPGSTELKFILSGSSLDETLEWAVALERLDVASTNEAIRIAVEGDALSMIGSTSSD